MHSAILSVEMPEQQITRAWTVFWTLTEAARASAATKQLSENVWLINVQQSPAAFAQLVAACEQQKFRYEVLAIEHEPRWLPVGFDPKPT